MLCPCETDYILEYKEDPPSAKTILTIYKKLFGSGRVTQLERMLNEEETKYIVWFCLSVAGVVSYKDKGEGKKKKK